MAAIAFDNNTINIWQILTNNKFSPKYLFTLYGQTALFLHYEDKNNIFFAGGENGTIKCYELNID